MGWSFSRRVTSPGWASKASITCWALNSFSWVLPLVGWSGVAVGRGWPPGTGVPVGAGVAVAPGAAVGFGSAVGVGFGSVVGVGFGSVVGVGAGTSVSSPLVMTYSEQ